jgi:hypothetical protein
MAASPRGYCQRGKEHSEWNDLLSAVALIMDLTHRGHCCADARLWRELPVLALSQLVSFENGLGRTGTEFAKLLRRVDLLQNLFRP